MNTTKKIYSAPACCDIARITWQWFFASMLCWPATGWCQITENIEPVVSLAGESFLVRLEVMEKVAVSPERPGFLSMTTLTPGTLIEKGTVIAVLDHAQEELEILKLEAEIAALQEQVKNLSEVHKAEHAIEAAKFRVEELQSIGRETRIPKHELLVPKLELIEAKTELATSQASLEDALSKRVQAKHNLAAKKIELKIAQLNLERSFVRAPFDGIVFKQFKHPEETLTQEEAIAEVYRLDYLFATVLLKQDEIAPHQFSALTGSVVIGSTSQNVETYRFEDAKVLPRIERDGRYLGVVKIRNQKVQTSSGLAWVLLPGMEGKLAFDTNQEQLVPSREQTSSSTPAVLSALPEDEP